MNEIKIRVGLIASGGLVWLVWFWRRSSVVERTLRARTPDDCPACHGAEAKTAGSTGQLRAVQPWSEVKSRRGAPKRVKTEGYTCPNRACEYYGITDARVHALVGYGGHGRTERIQELRCQACVKKVNERWGTPWYRLKTAVKRIGEVLAAVRVFGHGEGTIRTWLTRAGLHAERVHEHFFRELVLEHVQLDGPQRIFRLFGRFPVGLDDRLPGCGLRPASRPFLPWHRLCRPGTPSFHLLCP